jgi:hypothetical protein
MKRTIAIWAAVGFLVAAGWSIYPLLMGSHPISMTGTMWAIINITCPVVAVTWHLHVPLYFFWAMLANALTYGGMGLLVEIVRHRFRDSSSHTALPIS